MKLQSSCYFFNMPKTVRSKTEIVTFPHPMKACIKFVHTRTFGLEAKLSVSRNYPSGHNDLNSTSILWVQHLLVHPRTRLNQPDTEFAPNRNLVVGDLHMRIDETQRFKCSLA